MSNTRELLSPELELNALRGIYLVILNSVSLKPLDGNVTPERREYSGNVQVRLSERPIFGIL